MLQENRPDARIRRGRLTALSVVVGLALSGGIGLAGVPLHAARADAGPPVPAAARDAIRSVIRQQMDAFLADDGRRAFSFASPRIRRRFQSPDIFMAMVRRGYAPVYRPRQVAFRTLVIEDGRPVQRVLIVGPDNQPVIARYIMQQQPDGRWLIDGCILETPSDTMT